MQFSGKDADNLWLPRAFGKEFAGVGMGLRGAAVGFVGQYADAEKGTWGVAEDVLMAFYPGCQCGSIVAVAYGCADDDFIIFTLLDNWCVCQINHVNCVTGSSPLCFQCLGNSMGVAKTAAVYKQIIHGKVVVVK